MDLKYRYILWDFDGTVVDTGPSILRCLDVVCEQEGMEIPPFEVKRKFIGPPIRVSFMDVFGVESEEAERLVELYRAIHRESGAAFEGEPYTGMEALLSDLNDAGMVCAVASAKNEATVEKTLERLNLRKYFQVVAGAPPDNKSGDKVAIINNCIDRLGVDKRDALMIGDSPYDGLGAQGAGVDFCAAMWGYGFVPGQVITGFNCVFQADDVQAVRNYLLHK